jgi:hypothetical protein
MGNTEKGNTMNLTTFARLASSFYQSGKCVYLRSGPGRGKTTTIESVVPRIAAQTGKNLGIVVVSAPNLQPGDTVGFGIPRHNGDGTADMVFTRPFFFTTEEGKLLEEYDGGVLFLDEMDKADVDVKKVVGEMALSGRCGPHKLPEGWVVWMAGNRQGDRSGSTKELDHLINRRFEIDITDDIQGWEQWAIKNNVHHSIIAFAVSNPQIVFPDGAPEKQGPFCTPRSLVAVGEVLYTLGGNTGNLPVDTDAVEVAAAGIGQAAAAQLFATIRLEQELPAIQTILNNPGAAKIPGAPDAQMLVCYKLASLTDKSNLSAFITYIERLPADFSVTYAKSLCTRNPMVIAEPAMLDWTKRNSAILGMMSLIK